MPAVDDEVRPGEHTLKPCGPRGRGQAAPHRLFGYFPAATAQLAYRLKRSRRVGELVRAQQPYGVLLTTVPELLPVQPVGKPLEP